MSFEAILRDVAHYYAGKLRELGPTARGVDWKSEESQVLRFDQLLKVCDRGAAFTLNDYGCGYGALLDRLLEQGIKCGYRGYDISPDMIAKAQEIHRGCEDCVFTCDEGGPGVADYTVASGIFNVRRAWSEGEWREYMLETVARIAALSGKGFAFNVLSLYSDPERRRADLHYADPLFWFDHCKRKYSRFVTLVHDYPLYEFTILVRK